MRVFTSIAQHGLNAVEAAVRNLEAAGFDGVTTQENKHDPFLPLAIAATSTRRMRLQTSIAIAFSRSPMPVANAAWDLQAASNGRFTLGLGSQVKGHNVRRFSVPWGPPAPRMREYVQALRAIWRCWQDGGKLNYEGEHYQFTLMTPNFRPERLPCGIPKVQIAAVGPAMMKVAADVCDGVMLHPFCTRKYVDEAIMPRLLAGVAKAGRQRQDFEISGGGFLCTGETDDAVQRMCEWVRMRVGFYGSTPAYWPVFAAHGLEDLGYKLNAMSKKGQWEAMTREVSDDVARLFCAVGRHDQITAAVAQRFGGIADAITAPAELPPDLIQDLQRIAAVK